MTKCGHVISLAKDRQWRPGFFPNSEFQPIWQDPASDRSAFIVRFGPGGSIPFHDHPGREFAFMLDGEMEVDGETLGAGDFLTAGSGELHDVTVREAATFFIIIDSPIETVEPPSKAEVPAAAGTKG